MKVLPKIDTTNYQKIVEEKSNSDFLKDLEAIKSIDLNKDTLGFSNYSLKAVKNPFTGKISNIVDPYKCSEIAIELAKKLPESTADLIIAKVSFLYFASFYGNIADNTNKESSKSGQAVMCEANYKYAAHLLEKPIEEKAKILEGKKEDFLEKSPNKELADSIFAKNEKNEQDVKPEQALKYNKNLPLYYSALKS